LLDETRIHAGLEAETQELETQSFIVKIWPEDATSMVGAAQWRGSITRVPGGERLNVSDASRIPFVIAECLKQTQVRLGIKWRLWLWLFRP
jgi:hypothetical protein